MKYRINKYSHNYKMINIIDLAVLGDTESLSSEIFQYTYNIYLSWFNFIEENNIQTSSNEIALPRYNPLNKYLTERDPRTKKTDSLIYLYEDNKFQTINLLPKVKTKRK